MADGDRIQTRLDILPGDTSGLDALDTANQQLDESRAAAERATAAEQERLGALVDATLARRKESTEAARLQFIEETLADTARDYNHELAESNQELRRMQDSFRAVVEEQDKLQRGPSGIIFDPQAPPPAPPGRAARQPNLTNIFADLFSGTQAGRIAETAADLNRLAGEIPKLDGGIKGLLQNIGPAPIAIAGVAAAIGILTASVNELQRQAKEAAEFTLELARSQFDAQQLLAAGDLERLESAREAVLAERQSIEARREALREQIAAIEANTGDLIEPFIFQLQEFKGQLRSLDEEFAKTGPAFFAFNDALNSTGAAAIRATQAQQEYAESLAEAVNETSRLQAAMGDLIGREAELTDQFVQQRDQRRDDRAVRLADQTEDAADRAADAVIDAANAAADAAEDLAIGLEQQRAQHQKRLEQIEAQGNLRVEQLRKTFGDRQAKAAQQIADIQTGLIEDDAEARAEFKKQQRRATRDFLNDVQSALNASDFGAIAELQRRRDAEKQDAREDFRDDKERRRQRAEDRIAEINRELEEFRQQTDARIRIEQEATRQAIESAEAESEAKLLFDEQVRERLRLRAERDSAENERRAERDSQKSQRREERNHNTSESRAKAAFDAQIRRIGALQGKEQERLDAANAGVEEIMAAERVRSAAQLTAEQTLQQVVDETLRRIERTNALLGLDPVPPPAAGAPFTPGGPLPVPAAPVTTGGGGFGFSPSSVNEFSRTGGRGGGSPVLNLTVFGDGVKLDFAKPEDIEKAQRETVQAVAMYLNHVQRGGF